MPVRMADAVKPRSSHGDLVCDVLAEAAARGPRPPPDGVPSRSPRRMVVSYETDALGASMEWLERWDSVRNEKVGLE